MSTIQFYGYWHGSGSFARISNAIGWALRRRGLQGNVMQINEYSPRYEDTPWPVGFNKGAEVAICVGYPLSAQGWLDGHAQRVLVTVCETDPIPKAWVDACNTTTLVVVPSEWCKEVLEASGVNVPIMVVPHGVDRIINPVPQVCPRGEHVKLLHVTGALSFPWRKSTSQVLLAYKHLKKTHPELALFLRTPRTPSLDRALAELNAPGIVLEGQSQNGDILYESYDAVIQPSRGEGFGMVPLEARCLGVPALLTRLTGHGQHFATGVDIEVHAGHTALMSSQDNNGGFAPTVTVQAVGHAIEELLADLQGHQQRATAWAVKKAHLWRWTRVLQPLVKEVAKMIRRRHSLRLGEEAGL